MPIRCLLVMACLLALSSRIEAADKEAGIRDRFDVVETKLTPIAKTLDKPGPHDWLANQREAVELLRKLPSSAVVFDPRLQSVSAGQVENLPHVGCTAPTFDSRL